MGEIWFTSDLHLSHQQEFLFGPRGFKNEKEMNEAILENWNKVVKPDDIVWNLGDMAMNDIGSALPYLKRMNGVQYWLLGNHDTNNKVDLELSKMNEAQKEVSMVFARRIENADPELLEKLKKVLEEDQ